MVRKDIKEFKNSIKSDVTIVAATKYVGSDDMRTLFDAGIIDFGENRVDSFLKKYDELVDIKPNWHFIGHLQTNKAKLVINKIDYLHSLDSLKLASIIEKERKTPLKTFIEVSINNEENKNGVPVEELTYFVQEVLKYKNIKLVGLMMMGIKNDESDSLRKQFCSLRKLKEKIESDFAISLPYLSMGMSDDYNEAILEGATHIRLGRILFDM